MKFDPNYSNNESFNSNSKQNQDDDDKKSIYSHSNQSLKSYSSNTSNNAQSSKLKEGLLSSTTASTLSFSLAKYSEDNIKKENDENKAQLSKILDDSGKKLFDIQNKDILTSSEWHKVFKTFKELSKIVINTNDKNLILGEGLLSKVFKGDLDKKCFAVKFIYYGEKDQTPGTEQELDKLGPTQTTTAQTTTTKTTITKTTTTKTTSTDIALPKTIKIKPKSDAKNEANFNLNIRHKSFITCNGAYDLPEHKLFATIFNVALNKDMGSLVEYLKKSYYNVFKVVKLKEEVGRPSMFKWLKRISENFGRYLFINLLESLTVLRELNFLHKDICLENILLTKTFQPKLSDFGSIKRLKEGKVEQLENCGTPFYMCLEYFQDTFTSFRNAYKVDYYSLGVMLY